MKQKYKKYKYLLYWNQLRHEFVNDLIRAIPVSEYKKDRETHGALVAKVTHMLGIGDLKTVLEMLISFKNGTKRLKTKDSDEYPYIEKNGNFKMSRGANLKRGHFRWDYNRRYVLPEKTVDAIHQFAMEILNSSK